MARLRVDGKRFLLLASLAFIVFLSGSYLGGIFLILFRSLLVFFLIDIILLAVSSAAVMHIQNFSTEHPVKGEDIDYTLKLYFESFLPGLRVFVAFKGVRNEGGLDSRRDFRFFPGPAEILVKQYTVQCPFRGVYTVGLERLDVEDLFSFFSVSLKVWHRTFYVYPRLIRLESCLLAAEGEMSESMSLEGGGVTDNTRLLGISEYLPGESVRSIAWKRFAAAGIPYLRIYETSSSPGITLYLDLRRKEEPDHALLDAEDCSIEVLIAVLSFFLRKGVPVFVRVGRSRTDFGTDDAGFRAFFESTVNWSFGREGEPSVCACLEADKRDGAVLSSSVVGIFRGFDEATLAFVEDQGGMPRTVAVVIASALSEEEERSLELYRSSGLGADRLVIVRNSETIQEDLS